MDVPLAPSAAKQQTIRVHYEGLIDVDLSHLAWRLASNDKLWSEFMGMVHEKQRKILAGWADRAAMEVER